MEKKSIEPHLLLFEFMCFQSHCHRCVKFASRSMSSNGSDETAHWIRQRRFMDVAKEVCVTEEDRDRNKWTQMIHSVNPKWCSWKTKGSEINTLYESILPLITSRLLFSNILWVSISSFGSACLSLVPSELQRGLSEFLCTEKGYLL